MLKALVVTAWCMSSTSFSSGMAPRFWPLRRRGLTVRWSTSRWPSTSMSGVFSSWARRILAASAVSSWSTSTRKPLSRSATATSSAYPLCSSRTGLALTCTGESHSGNAPAVCSIRDADEPLQAPVDDPVDDHRGLALAVAVVVRAAEAPRQLEVELDGAHLPLPAERVVHDDVDLRPVERAVPLLDVVAALSHTLVEDRAQGGLRLLPGLRVADVVVGPGAEPQLVARMVRCHWRRLWLRHDRSCWRARARARRPAPRPGRAPALRLGRAARGVRRLPRRRVGPARARRDPAVREALPGG